MPTLALHYASQPAELYDSIWKVNRCLNNKFLSAPKNGAIFILHVLRLLQLKQLSPPTSVAPSEAVAVCPQSWLTGCLSPRSRAVVPMDPQWIPHLHPVGPAALCLPVQREPIHLQGGLVRHWELLLHRVQPVHLQERVLQLHPSRAPGWTLVPYFLHSLVSDLSVNDDHSEAVVSGFISLTAIDLIWCT